MATDNALSAAARLVSCARCDAYADQGGLLMPCQHLVCADCGPWEGKCRVCWTACEEVLVCPTLRKVADLLALCCLESHKPAYKVVLLPWSLPGLRSLHTDLVTVEILGDVPVDQMAVQIIKQLGIEAQLVFGMYGERLTGAEMLSELSSCFDQGGIKLECGVMS